MVDWRSLMVSNSLWEKSTEEIAYQLLDLVLVRETADGIMAGRIVECEMYQGPGDKGAHSYGGVPTPRTEVMYGAGGVAYVYLIYGMYHCLNVVTGPQGTPHAILIRALEPLVGVEQMRQAVKPGVDDRTLLAGPGKICRALNIDRTFNGHPLWRPPLYLAQWPEGWPPYEVSRGPRINIGYAEEAQHFPWRFWVAHHPSVSKRR